MKHPSKRHERKLILILQAYFPGCLIKYCSLAFYIKTLFDNNVELLLTILSPI